MAYVTEAFGAGHVTGITSWLDHFAAGIVVTAMVAVSFGSYGASIIFGEDAPQIWVNVFASAIVVLLAVVVIVGANVVAKGIDGDRRRAAGRLRGLHRGHGVAARHVAPRPLPTRRRERHRLRGGAEHLCLPRLRRDHFHRRRPSRSSAPAPPGAMYIAVLLTTALYILISLGVFGSLTVEEVHRERRLRRHGGCAARSRCWARAGFTLTTAPLRGAASRRASSMNRRACTAPGYVTRTLCRQQLCRADTSAWLHRVGGSRGLTGDRGRDPPGRRSAST